METPPVHVPVMLAEVMAHLDLQPGQRAIDATMDGGGHTGAILERITPGGAVLGIDRDPDMIAAARQRWPDAVADGRLIAAHGDFRELSDVANAHGFGRADAILFDLGLSSHHFDRSGRGFSFAQEEPLDMRFDATDDGRETAADVLANRDVDELLALFRDYGEERYASRIARAIVAHRRREPLTTTGQLLETIRQVLPGKERHHAARSGARIFQALRIAVNDELSAVATAVPQAIDLLGHGGRIVVISFHSLEDRIVKRAFLEAKRTEKVEVITKRPLRPSDAETRQNSRAAPAKLRVARRV